MDENEAHDHWNSIRDKIDRMSKSEQKALFERADKEYWLIIRGPIWVEDGKVCQKCGKVHNIDNAVAKERLEELGKFHDEVCGVIEKYKLQCYEAEQFFEFMHQDLVKFQVGTAVMAMIRAGRS